MASERLTVEEKALALQMMSVGASQMGQDGRPVGNQRQAVISLSSLAELGSTDNDVVRAKLMIYKADISKKLAEALAKTQAQEAEISAEIARLNPVQG